MELPNLTSARRSGRCFGYGRRYLPAVAIACVLAFISAGGVAPVYGQAGPQAQSDLVLELQRLRRDLSDIQKFVYRGDRSAPPSNGTPAVGTDAPPQDAAVFGRLQRQILEIQSQIRDLTGHVERVQHDVRVASGRLDKLVADVDLRLRALEDGSAPRTGSETPLAGSGPAAPARVSEESGTTVISSGAATSRTDGLAPGQRLFGRISETDLQNAGRQNPAPPGTAGGATEPDRRAPPPAVSAPANPPAARPAPAPQGVSSTTASVARAIDSGDLPEGSVQEQYAFAFGKLKVRDYDGAESAFRTFIDRNPDDPLAGNAMYWMGETYYVRKQYPEAARIFLDAYQRFPQGNKAPDNLFKLARSLVQIGEKTSACTTFAELMKTFPDANTRILSKARDEMKSLSCG